MTPPATDPGEPPMNMRKMSPSLESRPISAGAIVSKPLVRLMFMKCASRRTSPKGCSVWVSSPIMMMRKPMA